MAVLSRRRLALDAPETEEAYVAMATALDEPDDLVRLRIVLFSYAFVADHAESPIPVKMPLALPLRLFA
jgi:hypothetical protein